MLTAQQIEAIKDKVVGEKVPLFIAITMVKPDFVSSPDNIAQVRGQFFGSHPELKPLCSKLGLEHKLAKLEQRKEIFGASEEIEAEISLTRAKIAKVILGNLASS